MSGPTLLDRELVDALKALKGGGDPPVSVSFLRKDRRGRQIIPFCRVGSRVLYDLDLVVASISQTRVGGYTPPRKPGTGPR